MGSFTLAFQRKYRYIIAAGAMLLAVALPAIVSADQLTERSVTLSSSSKAMTGVQYNFEFTAAATAGSFVVDFCANSPLIGQACTPPEGFDVSSATATGATKVSATANSFVGTKAITAGAQTFSLSGVTNPEDAGTIYARILTYSDTEAENYDTAATPGEYVDNGSVALSITDTVGVSGAVLETMTFCVADVVLTADCANAEGNAPVLALGEPSGDTVALSSGEVSDGDIYAQISTNAVNGAIVRLKSNAAGCGGLLRAGDDEACNIGPATVAGIESGQALFGVKVAAATDPSDNGVEPSGVFQAADGSSYNGSTFFMNYDADDEATGVTSIYGDPVLDTDNAPANNKNMMLTFGASISNDTPAGLYSADLSLIATGKF